YEFMTRNFRQAGADCGYSLTLSRILSESPMRPYPQLRDNLKRVRKAIKRLVTTGVLRLFPPIKETRKYGGTTKRGGRPQLIDVEWLLFPGDEVIADIRADNARKKTRAMRLAK